MIRPLLDRIRAAGAHGAIAGALPLQVGQAVTVAMQAATSLVLLRVLGPDAVGLYAISVALAAAAGFFDLSGASRLALTELARARGEGVPERAAAILARFLRAAAAVRLPLVSVFFLLAPWIAGWLYGRSDAGLWARWFALPLALDLPFNLLVLVLHGRGRTRSLARVETSRAIVTAVCTIAVLLAGFGLAGLAAVHVSVSVLASLWGTRAYGRLVRVDLSLPSWADLLRRAGRADRAGRTAAGFALAIDKNLANLGSQLPMLLVGVLRPDAAGYFSAALRTMSLPYPLVSAFARYLEVLLPFRAGEEWNGARRTFIGVTVGMGAAWAVVTAGMLLAGPAVLVRLAGAEYAPAIPALYPLALQSLATGAGVGIGAALRAIERPSFGIALQAFSIAAAAPVGYALIPGAGAVGGAWFHALRYTLLTAAGIAWVLWLTRTGARSAPPAAQPAQSAASAPARPR